MEGRFTMSTGRFAAGATLALLAIPLAGCEKEVIVKPPPRVETPADLPKLVSTMSVPISIRMSDIQSALDQAAPNVLWQIDQHEDRCVPAQRILKGKILGKRIFGEKGLKVSPDIGCQIVGRVVRGSIRLTGRGQNLTMTMPVSAVVGVRNVGGIIKKETATGAAAVRANVRLSMRSDWTPGATMKISYDWTNPPGIDLLGRRILFVNKADARLAKVVSDLEKSLPRQLQKLNIRPQLAQAWRSGFTTIQVNRENPPVWIRVTPQKIGLVGYDASATQVALTVAAETLTETFVGDKPADPTPTPLPRATAIRQRGLDFNIPVLADYGQLEPVVIKALRKRAAKGINLKDVGAVDAVFDKVTIYPTEGGKIAVGIDLTAQIVGRPKTKTRAQVWLTGLPFNEENSRIVSVRDLAITGDTSNAAVNLAIRLFTDPSMIETVRAALVEDFTKDYDHVITAAKGAIKQRRKGDAIISANITKVVSGQIKVTAQGLFLPVRATGNARILYRPGK